MLIVGDERSSRGSYPYDDPGRVLSYAAKLGDLVGIGIPQWQDQNTPGAVEEKKRPDSGKEMNRFNGAVPGFRRSIDQAHRLELTRRWAWLPFCVG